MGTRAIVTSQPVVACDVCGRRLLRGETPDVFVVGGQRRTVCELCVPRAAAEGWLREADQAELNVRPVRPRRRGSLFGRLRQLREGEEQPPREREERPLRRHRPVHLRQHEVLRDGSLYESEDPVYDFLEGGSTDGAPGERTDYVGALRSDADPSGPQAAGGAMPFAYGDEAPIAGEPDLARALEVFNAGDTAQRIAGVSRALGAPTVVVRSLPEDPGTVAILVAWELCWYRYEVDLGEEEAAARLVAEGMELDELAPCERIANALADEHGCIALAA